MGVSEATVNILELIPQRPPMVLVDAFEGVDPQGVSHTSFRVVETCLFVEDGRLTECGLIEHMAQSAAARVGWLCRCEGREVPIGFIGSVAKFAARTLPPVGCRLETSLRIIQEVGAVSLVELQTQVNGEPVACGNLKICLQQ